jgi:transposase-like protein
MQKNRNDKIRENRGIQIVRTRNIKKIDHATYHVQSQSNPKIEYKVQWEKNHWACECIDYNKHKKNCKHVYAVKYFLTLEKIKLDVEFLGEEDHCPICKKTDNVIKRGIRFNRYGRTQRYYCKSCKRRFTGRKTGFKGMKNRSDVIAASLDLYYRGLSLRQIVQHLETSYKIKISHSSIYYWIKKYVELITSYLQGLNVNFSERWHCDETILKVNGRHLLLWSMLDSETRFLISLHLSRKRGEEDASMLLKKALAKSKGQPMEIVTDGLESYSIAIKKELGLNPVKPLIHLQTSLKKSLNNKMERLNKTIKCRTKTMAGLYNYDSTRLFADGFSIYYNFIRPHISLQYMTPAMMLGINNERSNWLDLIIKSKKYIENQKNYDDTFV